MYATTELMLPMTPSPETDWQAHFHSIRKWFFGVIAVLAKRDAQLLPEILWVWNSLRTGLVLDTLEQALYERTGTGNQYLSIR